MSDLMMKAIGFVEIGGAPYPVVKKNPRIETLKRLGLTPEEIREIDWLGMEIAEIMHEGDPALVNRLAKRKRLGRTILSRQKTAHETIAKTVEARRAEVAHLPVERRMMELEAAAQTGKEIALRQIAEALDTEA